MPIVEEPDPSTPLSQGDILTDVRFFATADCWTGNGGKPVKAPFNLCMVLSRACVVAHKETVIVAAVEQFKTPTPRFGSRPTDNPTQKGDLPKGSEGFEKLLSFFTGIRDGRISPDVFYLGQLPGRTGRHAARFDSLHTIGTPQQQHMEVFLQKCRIASLNIDFCRDLHIRVFNAFANLGFDDHRWFATQDLQALVDQGRADLAALDVELAKKVAARSAMAAEGTRIPDKETDSARAKSEELKIKLAPYEKELERRSMASDGTSSAAED